MMEQTLEWYQEKAVALKRYSEAKPPNATAMTAVVTEMSLDGGKRAEVALKRANIESRSQAHKDLFNDGPLYS